MNNLTFSNLTVGYGHHLVLEDITGQLTGGNWIHVRGENGAGKTTFLRTLASFMSPISGELTWNDSAVDSIREEFRQRIRFVGHEVSVFEKLSVSDNLDLFSSLFDFGMDSKPDLLDGIHAQQRVEQLSHGQKRRLELSTVINSPRDLILLDEPMASLDMDVRESLLNHFRQWANDGRMLVTASPDTLSNSDKTLTISNKTVRTES